jgi:hypothetical protein
MLRQSSTNKICDLQLNIQIAGGIQKNARGSKREGLNWEQKLGEAERLEGGWPREANGKKTVK